MTNIVPMFDRVLVKEDDPTKVTKGGIIVPETAKSNRAFRGTVVAVGPGKRDADGDTIPMTVKVGDRVLYGKYSGTDVKLGEEELLSISETDILGILVGDEKAPVVGVEGVSRVDAHIESLGDTKIESKRDFENDFETEKFV